MAYGKTTGATLRFDRAAGWLAADIIRSYRVAPEELQPFQGNAFTWESDRARQKYGSRAALGRQER